MQTVFALWLQQEKKSEGLGQLGLHNDCCSLYAQSVFKSGKARKEQNDE